MRELADQAAIRRFMRGLGAAAGEEATVYLAGGTTAVLLGWRASTVDVDLALEPPRDSILRAIQRLKDELSINVELASPADFIPLPAGWQERSPFVAQEGPLVFRHFDLYAQALSKLERAHAQDLGDARAMVELGLIERANLPPLFSEIEAELYRFPAIDGPSFRRRVEAFADPDA